MFLGFSHTLGVLLVVAAVLVVSDCAEAEGVVERWASAYRGKMLSEGKTLMKVGDSLETHDRIQIFDLQTMTLSQINIPDSIVLSPADSPFKQPRLSADGATVYFMSERPYPGLWDYGIWTGGTSLLYKCRANEMYFMDNVPELTSSGDTVWGSMSYMTLSDVGFALDEESGALYCLTEYRKITWPTGRGWPEISASNAKSVESRAEGGPDHGDRYELSTLEARDGTFAISEIIIENLPSSAVDFSLSTSRVAFEKSFQPKSRELMLRGLTDGQLFHPQLPPGLVNYGWGRFSPDGMALASIGVGSADAVMVTVAPRFDYFEPVCTPPGLMLSGLQWSPDGQWLITVGSAYRGGGCFPAIDYYLVVVELVTRECAILHHQGNAPIPRP